MRGVFIEIYECVQAGVVAEPQDNFLIGSGADEERLKDAREARAPSRKTVPFRQVSTL